MQTSIDPLDKLVNEIVLKTFALSPLKVEEIRGKGKNNRVFKVELEKEVVILRLSNSLGALQLYEKEKWCAEVVRNTKVPTPQILHTGIYDQYAFSFQEFIPGVRGTDAPTELGKIWFTLGRYAHIINRIPAPSLVVDYKETLKKLFIDDFFITRNIFSRETNDKIQSRLEETLTWKFFATTLPWQLASQQCYSRPYRYNTSH